ncbi:hypothetical protein [Sporosarcina sp. JAI121]|uniref:hypothetical protein n=1 Tax=Sporosarcina sp. JAI121 TaxID=2723064 RepID=UPI0015CCD21A|nr:hypothetical protein [Sporosarcina sp. JAI121]NYF23567.1 hypothetical protein [Sporosarcina sp. JAI121]
MKQVKINLPNLTDFEASQCTDTTRAASSGGMSIVNSVNGKRLTLNAIILDSLSHPDSIQIAYTEGVIAIAKNLGDKHTDYKLSKSGKMSVIYNTALVKEIVERYELDYSERTSLTFPVLETDENDGEVIVFIQMKSRVPEVENE